MCFSTEKLAQVAMFDKRRAGVGGVVCLFVHLMEMGVLKILVRVLVVYTSFSFALFHGQAR